MWERSDWTTLWASDNIAVEQIRYHGERHQWNSPAAGDIDAIVLMRCGAYRRRSDGVDHVVDPNTGCFRRVGEEVSVANFTGEPEKFTVVRLAPRLLAELFEAPELPNGPFDVTPQIDLGHRLMLKALKAGASDDEIEETAIRLVGTVVARRWSGVERWPRSTTEADWRSLASDACEVLHSTGGDVSLQQLARNVGCSPFHLSRVFRTITGLTVSRYRLRRRVYAALDRLSQGDEDLATVANAVGFADHSHMTRSIVAEIGQTPSVLRVGLRAGA